MVKNPPANAGDAGEVGSTPGWGRSSGRGHGNTLQYCCLENPCKKSLVQNFFLVMKTFVKVKVTQLCLTLWDSMDYTENF